MDIATLAAEMKAAAEVMPMDVMKMKFDPFGLASVFPDELKRIESVDDFGKVQVQFTHDLLSEKKFIRHLSYKREDQAIPSAEMQMAFRVAFFGDEKKLMPLPSLHGGHVIQLAKLEINNA